MMKTLKWSLWVALVAGVGVLTMMRQTRSPRPLAANADELDRGTAVSETSRSTHETRTPFRISDRSGWSSTQPRSAPDKKDVPAGDIASPPANVVRIRADQVLAQVNDLAIRLADLVPLWLDEQEQAMTVEEYESRLNRAVEMELTFQAAAARGVDLTPEQKKRVNGVAQKHEATFQEYRKQGVTWSSVTPAQIEFEQRLTTALLLQQNLVAKETHVAPSADPGVQARYEQARNEVLGQLKAESLISLSTAGM
jgi:hypothetical protein